MLSSTCNASGIEVDINFYTIQGIRKCFIKHDKKAVCVTDQTHQWKALHHLYFDAFGEGELGAEAVVPRFSWTSLNVVGVFA